MKFPENVNIPRTYITNRIICNCLGNTLTPYMLRIVWNNCTENGMFVERYRWIEIPPHSKCVQLKLIIHPRNIPHNTLIECLKHLLYKSTQDLTHKPKKCITILDELSSLQPLAQILSIFIRKTLKIFSIYEIHIILSRTAYKTNIEPNFAP